MDWELATRTFVHLGYIGVAFNSYLILRKCACSRYRRISMHAIGVVATFWALFYIWIANVGPHDLAVQVSRLGHTLTIGAFMLQQYMISQASLRDEATLGEVVRVAVAEIETHNG